MSKNMNRVLVTGSKGFVGSYVVKNLTDNMINVTHFDIPEHNLITDDYSCLEGVDGVIHLGAMKGIPECDSNPVGAVNVNILGTVKLLEACIKYNVKSFVYVSTWAVNSHNKKMYDVTKKAAEELVMHYIKHKGLNGKIIRSASLYGPGMAGEGAINQFVNRKKKGLPAIVEGDGWDIRQFTHVKDIANAIIIALVHFPSSSEPYYASAKEVVSINDLALRICGSKEHNLAKNSSPENYEVLRSDELEAFGWRQTIPLEKGIKEMMNYGPC